MGPSGSGKTTLLKILGGRLQENVRGTVTYNDIPYNTAINRRYITYPSIILFSFSLSIALKPRIYKSLSFNVHDFVLTSIPN